MDIDGREALIKALNDYRGSVILITHDLHLIELVADDLWLVKNGLCKPYDGDLEDYKNLLLNAEPAVVAQPKPSVSKTDSRLDKKQLQSGIRRQEKEIQRLTAEKERLENLFHTPLTVEQSIQAQKELSDIAVQLQTAEDAWLEFSEKLENL